MPLFSPSLTNTACSPAPLPSLPPFSAAALLCLSSRDGQTFFCGCCSTYAPFYALPTQPTWFSAAQLRGRGVKVIALLLGVAWRVGRGRGRLFTFYLAPGRNVATFCTYLLPGLLLLLPVRLLLYRGGIWRRVCLCWFCGFGALLRDGRVTTGAWRGGRACGGSNERQRGTWRLLLAVRFGIHRATTQHDRLLHHIGDIALFYAR